VNDFYRSIEHIIGFGIGNNLNKITNNHIMEKYIFEINKILNYDLNQEEKEYENYSNGVICFNGVNLSYEYIKENENIKLIEDILNSNDIIYIKNNI